MSAAAAASSASRSGRMGAEVVGIDPAAENIAVARLHAARGRPRHRLSRHHRRGARRRGRALRRRDRARGRRARHRRRPLRRRLRRHGEARRPDDRRHHQPHHEGLRACHRRRRIHPPLAAARHPFLRQAGKTLRARRRLPRRRPVAHRRDRHHVRAASRPLAPHQRPGRQLHDVGGEALRRVGKAKRAHAAPTGGVGTARDRAFAHPTMPTQTKVIPAPKTALTLPAIPAR